MIFSLKRSRKVQFIIYSNRFDIKMYLSKTKIGDEIEIYTKHVLTLQM